MTMSFDIDEVAPYINWAYLYHTWQIKREQAEAKELKSDAMRLLDEWQATEHTHAAFALYNCHSDGDDIMLASGERIPLLRQQHTKACEPCLCLSDFINPAGDKIGLFCCTCAASIEGDDYERLLRQSVADRLAEATAELLHLRVRKEIWGYAHAEQLSIKELHNARYQGIRPAVGYPCLPDQSVNFVLDGILHFDAIGVRLTESGAMMPHASVSGLMIAHPASRYFAVGRVGEDQLHDYALRRGLCEDYLRPFLGV